MTLDQVDRAEATVAQVVAAAGAIEVKVGAPGFTDWVEPPIVMEVDSPLFLIAGVTNTGEAPASVQVAVSLIGPGPAFHDFPVAQGTLASGETWWVGPASRVLDSPGEWSAQVRLLAHGVELSRWEQVVASVTAPPSPPPSPWEQLMSSVSALALLGLALGLVTRVGPGRR